MKRFIQLTFLTIVFLMNSQDNGVCIKGPRFEAGEWVAINGKGITEKSFTLQKFDSTKAKSLAEVFTFSSDGSISHRLHNPEKLGLCGNGMLFLKSGTWSTKDDIITLTLEGGRITESTFLFTRKYKVNMVGWEQATFTAIEP